MNKLLGPWGLLPRALVGAEVWVRAPDLGLVERGVVVAQEGPSPMRGRVDVAVVGDATEWRRLAAYNTVRFTYADVALDLLSNNPGWGPTALADYLEPGRAWHERTPQWAAVSNHGLHNAWLLRSWEGEELRMWYFGDPALGPVENPVLGLAEHHGRPRAALAAVMQACAYGGLRAERH